jgi:hypothetical protein
MAGLGIAVQQHDGIALAGNEIVQPDAVELCEFALRRLRKRCERVEQGDRQGRQRDQANGTKYFDHGLPPVFP